MFHKKIPLLLWLFSHLALAAAALRTPHNSPQAKESLRLCGFAYVSDGLKLAQQYWPEATVELFEDRYSGMRALLRVQVAEERTVIAVGFRGVMDVPSAVSAISLGYTQSRSQAFGSLLEKISSAVAAVGAEYVTVQIDGHSLGASLSQLLSVLVAKAFPGLLIKNIAWNGVGGMDLIEQSSALNTDALKRIDSTQIRLLEDLGSRIGRHIPGESYSLRAGAPGHFLRSFIPYVFNGFKVDVVVDETPKRFLEGVLQGRIVRAFLRGTSTLGGVCLRVLRI